jgi:hypothetical protein
LCPPYRLKGARAKVGSHALRIGPFGSRPERTSQTGEFEAEIEADERAVFEPLRE